MQAFLAWLDLPTPRLLPPSLSGVHMIKGDLAI